MCIIFKVIMKVKWLNFAIHALAWVLLLVIPYVTTDQVFNVDYKALTANKISGQLLFIPKADMVLP